MKIRLIVLFFSFLFLNIEATYGQWDAQFSQYWKVKTAYNPSFVGESNNMEASLLHRRQWMGVKGAPRTSLATFHMPLDFLSKTHGVGAMLINERIGAFSNTFTNLQYAYKLNLKRGKFLNIGLQVGLANVSFDANHINLSEMTENEYHDLTENIPSGDGKSYDLGFGLSWVTPKYYVGLSVSHILEPELDIDDQYSTYMARTFYLAGGYNIRMFHPLLEFQPSALIKSDAVVTQVDITAKMEYSKLFSGGISWRKDDGFVFLLGLRIKNIEAGYSYDLSTSEIALKSNGSHELFMRYIIPLEKHRPMGKQKSIRVL